jgi:isoleucyl-tRNA synthetase
MKTQDQSWPSTGSPKRTAPQPLSEPLESKVRMVAPPNLYDFLAPYASQLPAIFVVSQVELVRSDREGAVEIEVTPPAGEKCERCWLYLDSVGQDDEHPTICARCAEVIEETKPALE